MGTPSAEDPLAAAPAVGDPPVEAEPPAADPVESPVPPLPAPRVRPRSEYLPALAVRRPITVLMSLAASLVVGFLAWRTIPVQLMPAGLEVPFMWVGVSTLPGAPADHERTVAEPLEAGLSTLPGLKTLRTQVRSDRVSFRVELEASTDADVAYDQIRDRLDRELPKLPEGSQQAMIMRHDPDENPLFIMGVVYPPGAENPYQLITERLARPLERQPGVSRVEVSGVRPLQVRIDLDDAALRNHGLDGADVVRILQQDHFTMALGAIEESGRRILVRAVARFTDLDTLRDRPLATGVRLGDVAKVAFGTDPEPEIHRVDGAEAATLMVYKESTANTIATAAGVAAKTREIFEQDALFKSWRGEVFFDQGSYISQSIEQLRQSAMVGGAIAVVCLFLFLRGLGMTLLVTLAIPLCLLATVVVLAFSGDSLNVMSMMGLMLAVGMVVDNAIVVLENIDRHRRLGFDPAEAAIRGTGEVALAVTLATMTTLVVFLPLILLSGHPMVAFFMGKIGFPVCYALLASLVVALIYIPSGARRLKQTHMGEGGRLFGVLTGGYARLLGWVLGHRLWATLAVLGFIASMVWPFSNVQRVDQLQAGLDSVRVRIGAPANATFEELDATAREFEAKVLADKDALDVRAIFARTGYSRSSAHVQLFFKPIDERKHARGDVTARLQKMLPQRPGFRASVGWQGDGGEEGGIALSITGPDTDLATELAEEVMAFLVKVPGVESASLEDTDNTTELRFVVDRNAAERAGVTPLDVGSTLDYTLRGRRLADFPTEMGEVEMVVGLAPEDRQDAEQVTLLQVRPRLANRLPDAAAIARGEVAAAAGTATVGVEAAGGPLDLLAPTQRAPGYGEISRVNRRTQVTVRVTGDEARLFTELRDATAGLALPPGYRIDFGTRFGRRTENEEGGAFAMVLAIILVFFLMGVLFESFLLPLSILLSVPLAFAGVAWTLYLTDTPLDVMAIVGGIILVGVVVNNGIVLIDQVQQRRAAGEDRTQALIEGARHRVRPILMTAFTTIGGLIPMAIGRAALLGIEYYPLGRVVIGGMLTGTFLTLLAVPLLYSLLDDLRHLPRRVGLFLGALRSRLSRPAT